MKQKSLLLQWLGFLWLSVAAQPVLSQAISFSPSSGPVGTLVTITGTHLSASSSLKIGGVAAIPVSVTDTVLVAMVMPGAVSGPVMMDTVSRGNFTVMASAIPNAQQGGKLVGDGSIGNARQGTSLALSADGNTAIVGGSYDNNYTGAAWVFTRSDWGWIQQGAKLVGTGGTGTAQYQGSSVSLSADGNTAIIGGQRDNNLMGAAWVFTRSNGVWTQQGDKLVGTGGTGASQFQGNAVSLSADGNTAIIGGKGDNNYMGATWVFTRSNGTWAQQGNKLVGTGGTANSNQGLSVSLSADGNTAIIGAYADNNGTGASWVFIRNNGNWTQQGIKLVGTGGVGIPLQGSSVSLSADGNKAIIGGYGDNNNTGAAWVFTRSNGTWTQQGNKLVGTGGMGSPQYQGYSVSLSADGNEAIIGGYADNNNTGAAWVFARSNRGWTQQGIKLRGTGGVGTNQFQGSSVSLSADGNTALIGGPADNNNTGAAWVFTNIPITISSFTPSSGPVGTLVTITGTNLSAYDSLKIGGVAAIPVSVTDAVLVAMVMPGAVSGPVMMDTISNSSFTVTAPAIPNAQQGGKLVGNGTTGNSRQGTSLALSADGNTAIIGGQGDNNFMGAAWVFIRSNGVWIQQGGKLVGTGGIGTIQYQGSSVALSADGNTAIIGGQKDNNNIGAAWVFTQSNGVWTQQGDKLVGTGGVGTFQYQGQSVALSADGNTAIIGGQGDNNYMGATWIFTRSNGIWTQQGGKLVGTGGVGASQSQGISVSLSADGNTAIIGGYGDNNGAGASWVFNRNNGNWTQQGGKLTVSGGASQGNSVSLSADGNTAIIGGYGDNNYMGAAWVFSRNNGKWAQQGNKLVGTGGVGTNQYQGYSVSLSADGNTAIIGGIKDNNYMGAAWVFARSHGIWTQQGNKLTGRGASGTNQYQGCSVSISADGNTALIGGYGDSYNTGAAWVITNIPITINSFTPSSGPVGTLVTITGTNLSAYASLKIGGVAAIPVSVTDTSLVAMVMPGAVSGPVVVDTVSSDNFTITTPAIPNAQQGGKLVGSGSIGARQGTSLALSADGNTAIVGGAYDNNFMGAAWIFTRSNGNWIQQGNKLVGIGGVGTSQFQGGAVSLSADGNTAIIGGSTDNNYMGAVWVFTRSNGVWTQQGSKLVGKGGIGTAQYQGCSVSLSADGNTAIVGGSYENSYIGASWIFIRNNGVWTQQGGKLVGTGGVGLSQYQGCSVSLSADGNTAIVGGYQDNNGMGAAWVFTRSNGNWIQQGGKLTAAGGSYEGSAVSLSADGNTALIGGLGDNGFTGAAWVFTRSNGIWAQQGGKLVGTGGIGTQYQGYSVSLSADGNEAIIGGMKDNYNTGAAWVFARSNGIWAQQGNKLIGRGGAGANQFQGYSVALSADGNTALMGGYGDNYNTGAAWVITNIPITINSFTPSSGPVGTLVTINGTNLTASSSLKIGGVAAIPLSVTDTSLVAMVMPGAVSGPVMMDTISSSNFTITAPAIPNEQQGGKLVGTGNMGNSFQGGALALSADGNTAIIGGAQDNNGMGAAWIFTRSNGNWIQQGGKLVGTGGTGTTQYQGCSVSLSADGNTAIIGGYGDNNGLGGAAWVFVRSNGAWAQQGKLVGKGGIGTSQNQGYSVSLSADGNTAIIGGWGDANNMGAAWVFARGKGGWIQQGSKLTGTGGVGTNQKQGISVSLSADGNTAIIGGNGDNNYTGAAWVFTPNDWGWTQQGSKLTGTGGVGASQYQGSAVSLSADGNTAIIGGSGDNNSIGAAWVFTRIKGGWAQQGGKLVGTGGIGTSQFQGQSVVLSADGNEAIIGGSGDNNSIGAAWVFARNNGGWTQQGNKLIGRGGIGVFQNQAASVALSADGNTALIGSATDNSRIGAAWVFTNIQINSFTPSSGPVGTLVTITGTSLTASSSLKIGGVAAIPVSVTDTVLVAMVMPGAVSGPVMIDTVSSSSNFTVTASAIPNAQQGNKLVGTGNIGSASQGGVLALSADGNTAIIGGSQDNNYTGAAWIFTRSNGVWIQQGAKLVGTGGVGTYQYQGSAVSLSADGNTAIIGGSGDNNFMGATWVFARSNGVWTQQGGKLVGIGGIGAFQYQGYSVSLSANGNTAIIGGYRDNNITGAAWVFTRSNGVWTQQGSKLVGTGGMGAYQSQGCSVSLSADGNTALIGGYRDNNNTGAAWVFTRGNGVWTQQGSKLTGTGGMGTSQYQGRSVSISADGNTAIIGGYGDNNSIGAAWAFTRNNGIWTQQGSKLVGTGGTGSPQYQGNSVSLSADGNEAVIGGWGDNNNTGAAWVFARSNGAWAQQGSKLVGTGGMGTFLQEGASISLSADGNTALIGAPADNNYTGASWVFTNSSIFTSALSDSSFCIASALQVPFTATANFNTGNIFTAQLSDSAGSFAKPVTIGTVADTVAGIINASIPANTAIGNGYRIRVTGSSPAITGSDNGTNISIILPPVISTADSLSACQGDTTLAIAYTGQLGNATLYRVNFDSVALAAGFMNVAYSSLPASPITLSIPGAAPAGAMYNGSIAVSNANGCEGPAKRVTIVINALPQAFTVTGGGSYAAGSPGVSISLSGSQAGVNYTLFKGDIAILTLAGTGQPLSYSNIMDTGSYSIQGVNALTGCTATMNGMAVVSAALAGLTNPITAGTVSSYAGRLRVTVMPNPSRYGFEIQLQSGYAAPVSIRVIDMAGRLIEAGAGIQPNRVFSIGAAYRPGIYFCELRQGNTKTMVKLVKQSD